MPAKKAKQATKPSKPRKLGWHYRLLQNVVDIMGDGSGNLRGDATLAVMQLGERWVQVNAAQ